MDDTYGIGTRRWPGLFAALLLAASIAGSSEAPALPPLGRDAAGIVERCDGNAKTFQLRRAKDARRIEKTRSFSEGMRSGEIPAVR